MADPWDIAAAIGTICSAFFVAWQARETRRATNFGRQALYASQAVAIDSTRARLDLDAPRVHISIGDPSPQLERSESSVEGFSNPQPFGHGQEWHFPNDQAQRILVRVPVTISNQGSGVVELRWDWDGPWPDRCVGSHLESPRKDESMLWLSGQLNPLRPGVSAEYWFEADLSLEQWRENSDASHQPWACVGRLICEDGRDTGTVDRWEFRMTARANMEDPKRQGTWRLRPGVSITWLSPPVRERTYWLSQTARQPLPEPMYNAPSDRPLLIRLLPRRRRLASFGETSQSRPPDIKHN
jgi:hypothetical protein